MRTPIHRLADFVWHRISWEVWRDQGWKDTRGQYAAIAALSQRYGYSTLSAAEFKVFSQNGEDGILAEIFSRIGTTNKFFVEFGVESGMECNTRFLMEVLGWSGVYFEPNEKHLAPLRERLASRHDVTVLGDLITPDTVNERFGNAGVPVEFDVLSIDIDGQDYWVWEALSGFRPRVVVIEYNSAIGDTRSVEPRGTVHSDFSSFFGASMSALGALGQAKGYQLVHADVAGVNLFFVRTDLADCFAEPVARGPNYRLTGRGHALGQGEYTEV